MPMALQSALGIQATHEGPTPVGSESSKVGGAYQMNEKTKQQSLYSRHWIKDCRCVGVSTTNQIRHSSTTGENGAYSFTVTYTPGPSCDVCGKAWLEDTQRR